MYRKILLLACVAASAVAQSTITANPVSEFSDGQPQAPTGAPSVVSSATPMVISSSSYNNPMSSYMTETNSQGVVTGMPAVITSQPSVITSQPVSPTLASLSGYYYNVTSAANSTMMMTSATSVIAPVSISGSHSASAAIATATGGATSDRLVGAGVALLVLGAAFSML